MEVENLPVMTIKYGNKTFISSNYGWDGQDFCFESEGQEYVFRNCYLSDIKFGDLDYETSENIVMVGNNKVWE